MSSACSFKHMILIFASTAGENLPDNFDDGVDMTL